GFTALENVDFVVRPGERVGLIGPNGSGKSTLVNCIAGTLRNEEGSIRFEGEEICGHAAHRRIRMGLARSFQIPKPFASMTVLDAGRKIADGDPQSVVGNAEVVRAYLGE